MPKRSLPNRSMPNRSTLDKLDQAVTELLAAPGTQPPSGDPELLPLLRVAAELRRLPREDFRARLKSDLERKSSMTTATEPVTAVHTAAAPRIAFKDAAKAIDFYKNAFGAKEIMRFQTPTGIPHAEIKIGDSLIMLTEEWPEGDRFSAETLGKSPISLALEVPDVDGFVEHAAAVGAKLTHPPTDQFYGHRDATLVDPFGYVWGVYTRTEEMPVEEMYRRFQAMMKGQEKKKPAVDPVPKGYSTLTTYLIAQDADALIEFLKKTFDAEELFRSGPGSQGGLHCEVRIGDSMLMVGGGGAGMKWRGTPMPSAFHIYVPDCDATYARALEAGAASVHKPVDQVYGERSAAVKDAAGNTWYIATYKGESYKWTGAPTLQPYLHPLRADPVINFLKRAFGAEDLGRHATPDGVIHHVTLKIGNAHMEMGEAHGPYQPMPTMFYLYVEDCDALYKRALSAGATSISEPVDQPYGDRSGGVTDPFGNKWYIATHIRDAM
ncbi:MAG: VOC family protein [Terriglobales bacterium]